MDRDARAFNAQGSTEDKTTNERRESDMGKDRTPEKGKYHADIDLSPPVPSPPRGTLGNADRYRPCSWPGT